MEPNRKEDRKNRLKKQKYRRIEMKNDGLIIDCFAGGGGASVGIEMALGRPVDKM